jgi:type VI protein secretion system component VasK
MASEYFHRMNRRWVIRLVLAALAVWLAWKVWRQVEGDPILTLIFFLVGGVIAAFVLIKVVLVRMADALGNAVFLSGGPLQPEDAEKSDAEEVEKQEEEPKTELP